jgi:hypothetical protein
VQPKPAPWWKRRLNWREALAVYAGAFLFWQVVKAWFPEQSKAFIDTFGLPFVVIFIGLIVYGIWRRYSRP